MEIYLHKSAPTLWGFLAGEERDWHGSRVGDYSGDLSCVVTDTFHDEDLPRSKQIYEQGRIEILSGDGSAHYSLRRNGSGFWYTVGGLSLEASGGLVSVHREQDRVMAIFRVNRQLQIRVWNRRSERVAQSEISLPVGWHLSETFLGTHTPLVAALFSPQRQKYELAMIAPKPVERSWRLYNGEEVEPLPPPPSPRYRRLALAFALFGVVIIGLAFARRPKSLIKNGLKAERFFRG